MYYFIFGMIVISQIYLLSLIPLACLKFQEKELTFTCSVVYLTLGIVACLVLMSGSKVTYANAYSTTKVIVPQTHTLEIR